MGIQNESYDGIVRSGATSGVGTTFWQCSVLGNKALAPTRQMQDNNILHDKDQFVLPMITAPVAGAYPLYVVTEGIWVVDSVAIYQRVLGTSITFDVLWVASGTAIASGTTQLTGTIDGSVSGNNLKYVLGVLIATPTQSGPGTILGVNIGGTVTGFIGSLQVHIKRIG
jgi:hypothetical protein